MGRAYLPCRRRSGAALLLVGAPLLLLGSACDAIDGIRPVSSQGERVMGVFNLAMVLSGVVLVLVIGLLLYSIVRFRARPGDDVDPPQVEGNRTLEITWTTGAILTVLLLAIVAIVTMGQLDATAASATMTVQVIGHQWWWEYRYPNAGVVTANELRLPTGTQIALDITSADVVHAFWVPRFGWQKDATPGKGTRLAVDLNQTGTFEGECAEYCGTQHAWMRTHVIAESPQAFQQWLTAQARPAPAPTTAQTRQGQQLFMTRTCASCHTIRGTAAQGKVGPDLTHVASRGILAGGVVTNTPQNLQAWITNPQTIKPGVLMPSFQDLSPQDMQALVAYLETLK